MGDQIAVLDLLKLSLSSLNCAIVAFLTAARIPRRMLDVACWLPPLPPPRPTALVLFCISTAPAPGWYLGPFALKAAPGFMESSIFWRATASRIGIWGWRVAGGVLARPLEGERDGLLPLADDMGGGC